MNAPETSKQTPSGMQSAPGSDGELSDRPGTAGFPTGAVQPVSGSATKEPDRSDTGFPTSL